MSLDLKYLNVCRTCLESNSNMKSVFGVELIMEEQIILSELLMSFTSLQVYKGDGLPEQVCLNCSQEINRAFLFRKLCEKSDVTLRGYFQNFLPPTDNTTEINTCLNNLESFEIKLPSNNADSTNYSDKIAEESINNDAHESDYDDCTNQGNDFEQSDETSEDSSQQKKTKHKKKVYPCKECDKRCLGLGDYRHHMAKMHGKTYKCDTCKQEFRTESLLNRHLLSHKEKNSKSELKTTCRNKTGITKKRNLPRTCNICNKTFRFHSNLERHKLIHTGEKPYLCNVCGKGFAQLSYLKIHSFIHTGEKPYECKMCDKSFAAPGTLMTHIRTHTGERPHICKICGKDFPQSGYLSAHIRTHTGEKPVECKVCNRRFNQSGRLIIHMRIHSGEKPYSCNECGRSFAVQGTLKKHIRTHTGEKPYICSACGQAFAQSGTLATHMKVHRSK